MADGVDQFRTRDHVADFESYLAEYTSRSERSRARHNTQLNLRYGEGPGEILDLFFPAEMASPCPIHLFIHGGYWRMFSKDDFSFVADTVVASGGIAAIIDYDLMPSVRMETVVAQVRRAATWVVANAASFGGDPDRLTISGHSAGAHLCCALLEENATTQPDCALLLSGIYDLAPLQTSFLQPLIGLTDAEIARFSPLAKAYSRGSQAVLLVGEHETAPFHAQANEMQRTLAAQGVRATLAAIPGKNHMSIVLDLGDGSTEAGQLLSRVIKQQV